MTTVHTMPIAAFLPSAVESASMRTLRIRNHEESVLSEGQWHTFLQAASLQRCCILQQRPLLFAAAWAGPQRNPEDFRGRWSYLQVPALQPTIGKIDGVADVGIRKSGLGKGGGLGSVLTTAMPQVVLEITGGRR